MGNIIKANLSYSKDSRKYTFSVNVEIHFQTHELNSMWWLQTRIMENDSASSDDRLRTYDHNFRPQSTIYKKTLYISVTRKKLNTEPGDEEVFAQLHLQALEPPKPFTSDSIISNEIEVNP